MAFTNRFIKFPIRVFNKEEQSLTNNAEQVDSWLKLNPLQIESYRPDIDEEGIGVMLKSGDSVVVFISEEEFEQKLNSFTNQ
jgi:hypothetical protein